MSFRRDNDTSRHLRTITPSFALSITVQWPPGVTVREYMIHKKWADVKFRAFAVSPRNVYGLQDGTILCYWENSKGEHASCIRSLLHKDTTCERMKELDVISITCHKNCTVRISPRPFQTLILDKGKTSVYHFKRAKGSSISAASRASSISAMFELSSSQSGEPKDDTRSPQSSSASHLQSASQHYSIPETVNKRRSRSGKNRPPEDGYSRLPSPLPSFSESKKRPLNLGSAVDGKIPAKRPREEAILPDFERCSSEDLRSETAVVVPRTPCNVEPGSAEEEARIRTTEHQTDKNNAEMDFLSDHGQIDCQPAENEKETKVAELNGKILQLEKANEESRELAGNLRLALDQAESTEKALRETLQVSEENCQKLQAREKDLQMALQGAWQEVTATRKHSSHVELRLREEISVVEASRRKVEEEKNEAVQKWKAVELELRSERIRRLAAQSVFLDIKLLPSGDDSAPRTGRAYRVT